MSNCIRAPAEQVCSKVCGKMCEGARMSLNPRRNWLVSRAALVLVGSLYLACGDDTDGTQDAGTHDAAAPAAGKGGGGSGGSGAKAGKAVTIRFRAAVA